MAVSRPSTIPAEIGASAAPLNRRRHKERLRLRPAVPAGAHFGRDETRAPRRARRYSSSTA